MIEEGHGRGSPGQHFNTGVFHPVRKDGQVLLMGSQIVCLYRWQLIEVMKLLQLMLPIVGKIPVINNSIDVILTSGHYAEASF